MKFLLLALVLVAALVEWNSRREPEGSEVLSRPSEEQYSGWKYRRSFDEMRRTSTNIAILESENSVHFKFPYNGGAKMNIMIGNVGGVTGVGWVDLEITKGQFIDCVDFCSVSYKLDDGTVNTALGSFLSSGAHDVIRLNKGEAIIGQIKKSKKLIIEARFYSEGARQFNFDLNGLQWPYGAVESKKQNDDRAAEGTLSIDIDREASKEAMESVKSLK